MKQNKFPPSVFVFLALVATAVLLGVGCDRNSSKKTEKTISSKPFATGRLRIQQEEERKKASVQPSSLATVASASSSSARPSSQEAVSLSAIYPIPADWLEFYESQGIAEPILDVSVRAARSGYIKEVLFTPGDPVSQNDPLFTIQSAVSGASPATNSASPAANGASSATNGANILSKTSGAESNDNPANSSYSVFAPISGLTLQEDVQPGDWVEAGQTVLTRIVRFDYLTIRFTLSAEEARTLYARHRRALRLEPDESNDPPAVRPSENEIELPLVAMICSVAKLKSPDPWKQARLAAIDYVGFCMDPKTQAVQIRAVIPNFKWEFLPGEKVVLRIPVEISKQALLVDPQGVQRSLDETFVYSVQQGKEPKVQQLFARLSPEAFGMRRVISGLNSTDLYLLAADADLRQGKELVVNILSPQTCPAMENYNREFNDYLEYLANNSDAVQNILKTAQQIQTGQTILPQSFEGTQLPDRNSEPDRKRSDANKAENQSSIDSASDRDAQTNVESPSVDGETKKAERLNNKTELLNQNDNTKIPENRTRTQEATRTQDATETKTFPENGPFRTETETKLNPGKETVKPGTDAAQPGTDAAIPTVSSSPQKSYPLPSIPADQRPEQLVAPAQPVGSRSSPAPSRQTTPKTEAPNRPATTSSAEALYSAPITLPNAPSLPLRDPVTGLLLTLPDGYYPLRYWNRNP